MPEESVKIVVAIDVGTTYSGYAYSFTDSPQHVTCSSFNDSAKTPTSVLVDKAKRFVAFGDDAEKRFHELSDHGAVCHHKLYRNFKSTIINNETLSKKTPVRDISTRHSMSVFDIYVMTVYYLKNHVMRALNRYTDTYSENDVQFVILVPAIADDRTKWFLRQVALKTGIRQERLLLTLESEAASIWCQTQCTEPLAAVKNPGTKYIVIDIGGGVADISVHEAVGDGHVEALSAPCGGKWGGNNVEKCFLTYLSLLLGNQTVETFMMEHSSEWLKLLRRYEDALHCIQKGDGVCVEMPKGLVELARASGNISSKVKGTDNLIQSPLFRDHIRLYNGKLSLDEETTVGMFQYTLSSMCSEIDELFNKGVITGRNLNCVIVVGGLSASKILQDRLIQQMDRYDSVFPDESETFAINGALQLGHDRTLVNSRIMPLTYGLNTTVPFDDKLHKVGASIVINGKKMCTENVHPIVKAGTKVKPGQELHEDDMPLYAEDKELITEVVSCGPVPELPTLVTHCSVHRETSIKIPLPFGCQVEDKLFDRCVVLGETELCFKFTFKKGTKECFTRYLNYD